ncbi:hypothetical protein D3C85_1395180 [compost metagenome]
MAAGQVLVRLVFDETALQPLAAVDVDQQRARRLAEQGLQGRRIDDGRARQSIRGRAAVETDAIAVGGEQRGVGLGDAQQQAQGQHGERRAQQNTSGTRHGVQSL